MPLTIVRQDLVRMQVDAVVNAANPELQMGGGVCGAIFAAAGPQQLQAACDQLAPIAFGEAVITPGFALPAKWVIHAAGPVYDPRRPEQSEKLLRAAYTNSLKLAVEHQCESIAFPLISSGLFGYPKAEALRTAREAIREFLTSHDLVVYLAVYDRESFAVAQDLLGAVEAYIDEHWIARRGRRGEGRGRVAGTRGGDRGGSSRDRGGRGRDDNLLDIERRVLREVLGTAAFLVHRSNVRRIEEPIAAEQLKEWVGKLEETFSEALLRLIDERGLDDVDVYKRANIDRKPFSKIRSRRDYKPSKRTALALALALELSLDETADLLARAGYALSPSEKFDVIVEFFIVHEHYDIFTINEVLFEYEQPLLGA